MKKLFKITLLVAFIFCMQLVNAQTILVVEPGDGTLNTAIDTYKGDRIYQLKANEWYGLSKPIENVDYHLQIIGAEPAVKGGMPATLQTGSASGKVFGYMFDAKGDITLKNIYFVNADLSGTLGGNFMRQSKNKARVIIDGNVLHPAGVNIGVASPGGETKVYFTNNQVIDHGHQLSPNDGHFFQGGHATLGIDTLWVENNTFVCMGTNMFHGGFATVTNNVVCFNHNTIVFNKSQLDWSSKKNEEYWTNNLLFDVNTQPWSNAWDPMPGADKGFPRSNLIWADTLANEVLPSQRPNIVQFNAHYRAQGFYDLITEFNAFSAALPKPLPKVRLYPLVWPKDSLTSREAQMFNSVGFPKFVYDNTYNDVDPQWADAKIYEHETKFIAWTRPASYVHALSQPAGNYPAASAWEKYWWIPSGDLSLNTTWPVFNGKYNNPTLLKGAIENNVPLGDLNWYPEAKAAWMNKKAMIWAHIKSGSRSKIDIGYGPSAVNTVEADHDMIFPVPAKDFIFVKAGVNSDLRVMSLDGKVLLKAYNVSKLDVSTLSNGAYIVLIKQNDLTFTKKLTIAK